ncbi:hypothetical protein [Roseisolibacter sp. H3M3-2]|uniref:hypothetical protein n=1 Tax=Roseisolibacter sp. H3M3-2 TaxID=3031323 RepID=UPI0023DA0EBB|nr:hypothetical protein [Roseisolibacter sp. H3M3-2]MDF1505986.1 hypothetical protein [Roseisolibacter sp. H3M3-2]
MRHAPGTRTPSGTARTTARIAAALALALSAACDSDDYDAVAPSAPPAPQPTAVVTASGDVAARVAEFRTLLGDPANGAAAGQQAGGRREISWDGAGANPFNNRNDFPADFFNTTARNGAVFTTPGTGFRNDSTRFADVDASYAAQFATFSPTKVFAPVGSHVMDVHFRVAGEQTPAAVTGFGVVFSDVDRLGPTTLEYFDRDGRSLGKVTAPARSDAAGLSLAGLRFADPIVARVRVTGGTGALGAGVRDVSAGGTHDLVVLDNFVFGEPVALPPR